MSPVIKSSTFTLYSSKISDCAARVRITLNLKGLPYKTFNINLTGKENLILDEFGTINPARTVPTLLITNQYDDNSHTTVVLTQSMTILEYLDEAYPNSCPVMPPYTQPEKRAHCRSLAAIIANDSHPMATHRVARAITNIFDIDSGSDLFRVWNNYLLDESLASYEKAVKGGSGTFSIGDSVTMADIVLLPQAWRAARDGLDLEKYPALCRIFNNLCAIERVQEEETELEC